jgi:hypothetical protein
VWRGRARHGGDADRKANQPGDHGILIPAQIASIKGRPSQLGGKGIRPGVIPWQSRNCFSQLQWF